LILMSINGLQTSPTEARSLVSSRSGIYRPVYISIILIPGIDWLTELTKMWQGRIVIVKSLFVRLEPIEMMIVLATLPMALWADSQCFWLFPSPSPLPHQIHQTAHW
jgi:hypothetical protein